MARDRTLDPQSWPSIEAVPPEVPKWRHEGTLGYVGKIEKNTTRMTDKGHVVKQGRSWQVSSEIGCRRTLMRRGEVQRVLPHVLEVAAVADRLADILFQAARQETHDVCFTRLKPQAWSTRV